MKRRTRQTPRRKNTRTIRRTKSRALRRQKPRVVRRKKPRALGQKQSRAPKRRKPRALRRQKPPAAKQKRRIAIVTGTRAEYGLLRSVVKALRADPAVDVGLVVTGVHLSPEYGKTIEDIKADGFPVWGTVPMYRTLGRTFDELPAALARGTDGINRVLAARRPHVVVVLGDRIEAFTAALVAFYRRIPLAHIHGGELTDFHIDDSTRHALTRLAHLHFPATKKSAERLRSMGEEPFRIRACGAPGLDAIRECAKVPREKVLGRYGFNPRRPLAMLLMHPETTRWRQAGKQAAKVLDTLLAAKANVLALYPNGDPGSAEIVTALQKRRSRIVLKRHLPRERFIQALAVADVLAGNSSCGLIEASFTGTPVLHVGERNRGREHGANALFVPNERRALVRGLRRVLSPSFRARARRAPCPWGDGKAGARIARALVRANLGREILAKRLIDKKRRGR